MSNKNTDLTPQTHHTPGPWVFSYGSVYQGGNAETVEEHAGRIAQADRDNPHTTPCERDANCRLIAAAPELLEALKPFASLTVETCSKCEGSGKHGVTDMACTLCGGIGEVVVGFPNPHDVKAAQEALVKATQG